MQPGGQQAARSQIKFSDTAFVSCPFVYHSLDIDTGAVRRKMVEQCTELFTPDTLPNGREASLLKNAMG